MSLPVVPTQIKDGQSFSVFASVFAKEGKETELKEVMKKLQAASRQEPGVEVYNITSKADDPGAFLIYEEYKDREAFDKHVRAEAFTSAGQCGFIGKLDIAFSLKDI